MVEIALISKLSKQSRFTLNSVLKYMPIVGVFIVLIIVYVVLVIDKRNLDSKINETNELFYKNEAVIKQELGIGSYQLADKTNNLVQILSKRLYWSNTIGKFDNIFNTGTKVESVVFDMKNFKITVNASASNYEAVEKQVSDLKNKKDLIQSVLLNSPSLSGNAISFRLEITFRSDIVRRPYL